MNTINHEIYVSFEIAELLKKAGFDWKCEHPYFNGIFDKNSYEPNNFLDATYQIAAPTLEIAQKWLREVKDIDIYIFPTTNNKRGCVYECGIKTFGRALWIKGQPYTTQYDTYEEAQEAGIKKALEIILEKKE